MPVERPEIIQLLKSVYLFKKLDDERINFVADHLEPLEFAEGEAVYHEGDPGARLYLVLHGKVNLLRERETGIEEMGVLERGDIFGYEMLDYDSVCHVTAQTQTQSTLLCFDREQMRVLLEKIETLNLDLKILYESYKLFLKVKLNWREPDETVIYFSRQHGMVLLLRFLPILLVLLITVPVLILFGMWVSPLNLVTPQLLLIIDLAIILVWSLWTYVDWTNDYAFITSRRAGYIRKVILLHDSRQEAPLSAVLSVSTDTDFWGRTLSYGDVQVRTYAGSFVFPRVAYPKQVAALLGVQRERVMKQRVETEQSELEDVIRKRLGYKPKNVKEQRGVQSEKKPEGWMARLRRAFQMRKDTGDTVTWRTHWIMLLKNSLPALILMVGVVAVIILRIANVIPILPLQAVLALGGILFLIGMGWAWYVYLDWSNDIYIVTPDQVLDISHKPLAQEERRAAPLKNVLSIEYEQKGIFALLLNFGTVLIAVGETKLTFDDVPNPTEVQRELFKRLAMRDYREKHSEIEAEQKRVADWIAAYHRVVKEERNPVNHAP